MASSIRKSIYILVVALLMALPVSSTILYQEYTPDGRYLLWLADFEYSGIYEVYRSFVCGPCVGWSVKLSGGSMVGWDVYSFSISSDSKYVFYEKGCLDCFNGGPEHYRYQSEIEGNEIIRLDIFRDGFEGGGIEQWQLQQTQDTN